MLNAQDIDFILGGLDKVQFTGLQTALKLNEVFLKLNSLKVELAAASEDETGEEKDK